MGSISVTGPLSFWDWESKTLQQSKTVGINSSGGSWGMAEATACS
jgi:hypothetical protein